MTYLTIILSFLFSIFIENEQAITSFVSDYKKVETITFSYQKTEINTFKLDTVSSKKTELLFNLKFNKSMDTSNSINVTMKRIGDLEENVTSNTLTLNNYIVIEGFDFNLKFNNLGIIDTIYNYKAFKQKLAKQYDHTTYIDGYDYQLVKSFFETHLTSRMCFVNYSPISFNDTLWSEYNRNSFKGIIKTKVATSVTNNTFEEIATINFNYFPEVNYDNFLQLEITCKFDYINNIINGVIIKESTGEFSNMRTVVEVFKMEKTSIR